MDRPDRPGAPRRRPEDPGGASLDPEWDARDARRSAKGSVGEGFSGEGFTTRGFGPPGGGFAEGGHDPAAGFSPPPRALPDFSVLIAIAEAVRAALPRELQQQFTALLREILLAVRALIDSYLERLDGRSTQTRVEDIPID